MGQIADAIVPGARRTLSLAEALLNGVPAERFARLAAPGGEVVRANHGAFIYGHLSIYPQRVLSMAGLQPGDAAAPEHYGELFGPKAECVDDPDASVYPPMDEIVSHFTRSFGVALDALEKMSDERLAGSHGEEGRYKELFPTLGAAASFMFNNHVMLHLGQMSTWRRCLGLGSAT